MREYFVQWLLELSSQYWLSDNRCSSSESFPSDVMRHLLFHLCNETFLYVLSTTRIASGEKRVSATRRTQKLTKQVANNTVLDPRMQPICSIILQGPRCFCINVPILIDIMHIESKKSSFMTFLCQKIKVSLLYHLFLLFYPSGIVL